MLSCTFNGGVRILQCSSRLRLVLGALVLVNMISVPGKSWGQQPVAPSPLMGGMGNLFISQFANPAVVGALYGIPKFPLTGYYPVYPGGFAPINPEPGIEAGPLQLHPTMGVAEMYTDNVFRTPSGTKSDFYTTLAPGIQAQLPFAGRHLFMVDYRTNIQYYSKFTTNDVQDQTASGLLQFNFPGGLKVDLQGEHKLGHDPRGSAADLQALEVNKWTTNGFTGQAEYQGGQIGAIVTGGFTRWTFLNNNQGPIRDGVYNYGGFSLLGNFFANTSLVANFRVLSTDYDQNQNLDSTIYTMSAGARWTPTGITTVDFLAGYQVLQLTHAPVNQPPPILSQYNRPPGSPSSASGPFLSGTLTWIATPTLKLAVQPYRSIQPSVFAGTFFFTATGVNLSAVQTVTDRIELTANLGYEDDEFSESGGSAPVGPARNDKLRNIAVGLNYRAVKWVGLGFQYVYENRSSNQASFNYDASTFMLSAQALF